MNYLIFSTMFLIAFISIQLAIYIYLNRRKISLRGFLGLIISLFIYSTFYALELIAPNIEYMKIYTSIEYIGILLIPVFWIIMAISYTNKEKIIYNKFYISIFFIPICLWIINFTNEYHHLFYKSYSYSIIYYLHIADIIPGVFYYITMLYVNVCFFIGNILYIHNFFRENNLYKKRSFIMMITSLIPWVGYWVYMLDGMPVKIDIVPISLAILCLFHAYALFNSDIFGTISLARRIIFNDITDAIIVLDKYNTLIEINKKAEQIFNLKNNLIIGKDCNDIFKDHSQLLNSINENKIENFHMEVEIMGKVYYFQGKIDLLKSNKNEGKIIILIDNTEQIALNKKLSHYATIDSLTQVYNKSYFYELSESKLKECNKLNRPVSLIIFDLDKFKHINDKYGHLAGDIVLKKTLETCKAVLSQEHYLGRYGGEEFVILLNDIHIEKALEIAETIRLEIAKIDILYEGKIIKITSSFGVFSSYTEKNLKTLLKSADRALYEAKRLGRNRVCSDNDFAL